MTSSVRYFTAVFALVVASGCASKRGVVDPRALEAMQAGAAKVELHVDAQGHLEKVEVYLTSADRVPEAVRKLGAEQLKGGEVTSHEIEVLGDGSVVYEIEAKMPGGLKCEISATAEGQLRYRECQVSLDAVPEAVRRAALAVEPGEVVAVERSQGPGHDVFDVEVRVAGGELRQVEVSPTGQVIGRRRKLPATVELPMP